MRDLVTVRLVKMNLELVSHFILKISLEKKIRRFPGSVIEGTF